MFKKLSLALMLVGSLFGGDTIDSIIINTENYPPYNMMNNQQTTGISVDILEAMLKDMGSKKTRKDFKLGSWARGYALAEKKKNYMIFSTTRTKQREPIFKWVGPIINANIGLMALKSKKIVINDINDVKKYIVGAVKKDVGEQLLLEAGLPKKNIKSISGKDAVTKSFKKLEKGRIDIFSYNQSVAIHGAKSIGLDMNDYEFVYTLKESHLYFAFNKETDDKIINSYQKALDKLKANGTYDTIINKYK